MNSPLDSSVYIPIPAAAPIPTTESMMSNLSTTSINILPSGANRTGRIRIIPDNKSVGNYVSKTMNESGTFGVCESKSEALLIQFGNPGRSRFIVDCLVSTSEPVLIAVLTVSRTQVMARRLLDSRFGNGET